MFDLIIKILDKSKELGVDLHEARDRVIAEENLPYEDMKSACLFIGRNYDVITKCRRMGDNETIKAFVEADEKTRKEIAKEVEERVE